MKKLDGQKIYEIRTIKSWYDNDCICIDAGKKTYRMPTSTIIQMVNEFNFIIKKKIKYEYLIEAELKED